MSEELALLIECAEKYLVGKSNYAALNGYAQNLKDHATHSQESSELVAFAEEWIVNINRAWNEWGLEKVPLSESEFKRWLSNELKSFS